MAQPSESLRHTAAIDPSKSQGVRKQVWLVAGITLILACVMATYVEMKPRTVRMGMATLPMAVLFPFVFWLLGNSLLKRFWPGVSLSSAELRLLFCTLWVGGVFPGTNWATAWAGRVGAARYFASAENRWQELIFDNLPWWMFLTDSPGVLRGRRIGIRRSCTVGRVGSTSLLGYVGCAGDNGHWTGTDCDFSKTVGAARAIGFSLGRSGAGTDRRV